MKTNLFLTIALALCALAIQAQEKPQVKVDVSFNRQAAEVQEPGYELWIPTQGKATNTFENNGLKFTFTAPEGQTPDYICRAGWSKTPMQNADNKAKNGRLTMDGMTLDANDNSWKDPFYGQFTLKIEGLPAGSHTLITITGGATLLKATQPLSPSCVRERRKPSCQLSVWLLLQM